MYVIELALFHNLEKSQYFLRSMSTIQILYIKQNSESLAWRGGILNLCMPVARNGMFLLVMYNVLVKSKVYNATSTILFVL